MGHPSPKVKTPTLSRKNRETVWGTRVIHKHSHPSTGSGYFLSLAGGDSS
jgi:hypothetical protein